jgi:hypothetical protein
MAFFESIPLPILLLLSLALLGSMVEFGRFAGLRRQRKGGDNVGPIEAGVLGLLALLIGFTTSVSITRSEERHDAVLVEANAIGNTAQLAALLPEPYNTQIRALLVEYTYARLGVTSAITSEQSSRDLSRRSDEIMDRIWTEARSAAGQNDAMVPTGIFLQSVGALDDSKGGRRLAVTSHVPGAILTVLYVVAACAMAISGYSCGLDLNRHVGPVHLFAALIACVVIIIVDLDRPGSGLIVTDQAPLQDVARSLDESKSTN